MDPEAFATVAAAIAKGGTPAHSRTAVGRAYYSVFNNALVLLHPEVRFAKVKDKHSRLIQYLGNCSDILMQRVSSQLSELKDKRNQADYEMASDDAVENQQTVELHVETARRLNANLKSTLRGPNRAKIVSAINSYKKMLGDPL
jgi:uncharacterized protein (UPF0332 family)